MKNINKIGPFAMKALLMAAMLLLSIGATATFAQVSGDDLVGILAGAVTAVSLVSGAALGSMWLERQQAGFAAPSCSPPLDAEYYEACQDCQG